MDARPGPGSRRAATGESQASVENIFRFDKAENTGFG